VLGKNAKARIALWYGSMSLRGLGPGEELTVLTGKKLQGNPPESYGPILAIRCSSPEAGR
jgi:hypothetical protein